MFGVVVLDNALLTIQSASIRCFSLFVMYIRWEKSGLPVLTGEGGRADIMLAIGLEGAIPMTIEPMEEGWAAEEVCRHENARCPRQLRLNYQAESAASRLQKQIVEIYDALYPPLYGYLRSLRISVDKAEDVIQEVFLRLADHLAKGEEETNLRSWTFQVAHNLAMDIHRNAQRHKLYREVDGGTEMELADSGSNPEQQYLQKEELKRVEVAMENLTEKQRSGLLLRAQGLKYGEIASVLGVSEQRAIVLVKRALLRLSGGM